MRAFLRFCVSLIVLVLGGLAIACAVAPVRAAGLLQDLREMVMTNESRLALAAVGGFLVLLPLAQLYRLVASGRRAREISYQTEQGRISVSMQAIEEALTRAVEQEPAVRKVGLRLYHDSIRRQVVVDATLTLWDDGDITGINWRCMEILRRRFTELMPDEAGCQINISVHRLNQRRAEPAAPETEPAVATPAIEPAAPYQRNESRVVPLPGLSATHGGTDNTAGAALLARRKSSTTGRDAGEEPGQGQTSTEIEAVVEEPEPEQEPDPLENLYVGPRYTVEEDDDEAAERR